jgi:polar amino acid transport system substrate-binding protein
MTSTRRTFLTLAGGLLAAGCTKQVTGTPRAGSPRWTGPDLGIDGPIRIGLSEYRPYAFAEDDGEVTGQVPEVAKAVFDKLGVADVKPVLLPFDTLVSTLDSGDIDLVGGLAVSTDRCAEVDWSVPDHVVYSALAVPAGNPKRLKTFDEVISSGARLGVAEATQEATIALEAGVPQENLTELPDPVTMMHALALGDVDCVAFDDVSLRDLVATESDGADLEVLRGFTTDDALPWVFAFAFRKGDDRLREPFDEALAELHDSGEWLEIAERFEFVEENLPDADITIDDACGR